MNKEQQVIEKTIVQWTKLAETGGNKSCLGIIHDCYLCQYAYEKSERDHPARCKACPYYEKFGFCGEKDMPFGKWNLTESLVNKRIHAAAFLAQIKTLQEKPMDRKEIEHRIKIHENAISASQEVIAALEKEKSQLAEAEKPKPLEHGDYGLDKDNNPALTIEISKSGNNLKCCDDTCVYEKTLSANDDNAGSCGKVVTVLGNIFADLKAITPLKEFKLDVHKYYINKGKGWAHAPIHMAGNNHTLDELSAHIINLRRLEVAAKLAEASK